MTETAEQRFERIIADCEDMDPPLTRNEVVAIARACFAGGMIFLRNTFTASPAILLQSFSKEK